MKRFVLENIIKNFLIIIILVPTFESSRLFLISSPIMSDKQALGSLLTAVTILAMIACTGNYTFTYEKVNLSNTASRILAHATTGLLMLLIGLSLGMTSVLVELLIGKYFIFNMSLIVLYFTSILYDFWDLMRQNIAPLNIK